jgi:hypothetical protein
MNLLIFSPQVDRDESELVHVTRHHHVEIAGTPEEVILRLCESPGDRGVSIVILLISGMNELKKFVEAREYFTDKALILVLPEEDSELIRMGFRLRATYMGFRGGAFEDVAAVITRIQTRIVGTVNGDHPYFPERRIFQG